MTYSKISRKILTATLIMVFASLSIASESIIRTEYLPMYFYSSNEQAVMAKVEIILHRSDDTSEVIKIEKRVTGNLLLKSRTTKKNHSVNFTYSTSINNIGDIEATYNTFVSEPLRGVVNPAEILEKHFVNIWSHVMRTKELKVSILLSRATLTRTITVTVNGINTAEKTLQTNNVGEHIEQRDALLRSKLITLQSSSRSAETHLEFNILVDIESYFTISLNSVLNRGGYESNCGQHCRTPAISMTLDSEKESPRGAFLYCYCFVHEHYYVEIPSLPLVARPLQTQPSKCQTVTVVDHPAIILRAYTSNIPMIVEIAQHTSFPLLNEVISQEGMPEFLEAAGLSPPLASIEARLQESTTLEQPTEAPPVNPASLGQSTPSLPAGTYIGVTLEQLGKALEKVSVSQGVVQPDCGNPGPDFIPPEGASNYFPLDEKTLYWPDTLDTLFDDDNSTDRD